MTRNYITNYSNNQDIYSRVPRNWIKLAQIAGTFFSLLGLIFYIYYMKDIYNSLSNNDFVKKSIVSLLLSIITYFVWKSIYNAIIIIRLVNKCSDEELCANRYIISSLSLTIGGLFTPFLITSFPNVDTMSTIKPRYFLSKTMGFCTLIGAPILTFCYFFSLLVEINSVNPEFIFNTNSVMGIISILVLIIGLITFILGLTTTKLFSSNKLTNDLDYSNYSKLLKIISIIWMTILTVELVIVILFSIIRLISALADLFRTREESGGIIMAFLVLLNLFFTISCVWMVIYVTTRTIAGLWSIDGFVRIKRYKHNKYTYTQNIY
ncbi:hypothetical protein [Spiroplasma endosymbiont of Agriotes lineatus]|uniref:hypothetical protein n=1 Tax=Spiroplasma endosymbiont of Agriotes lineatus TaxID=3077930 RepID=UPI0030D587DB